ncbi:MAG: YicC/YloC family endoribonuclease [Bacteroidia bacterium]|jgi:uncharacterized protein (TIGR00255 family)
MIKSMTGFGKSQVSLGTKQVSIDVRALNSKQLDLNMRIPGLLRSREAEIRQQIASVLERGKIDCFIVVKQASGNVEINEDLLKRRFLSMKGLAKSLDTPTNELFSALLSLPDALVEEEEELADSDWSAFQDALAMALMQTDAFRKQEGLGLETELLFRVENISKHLSEIEVFEVERSESMRDKLVQRAEQLSVEFDRNRFEEELIYYIEKLDISEEKQRLNAHCVHFKEAMQEGANNGRKLGFIAQEMGREINTIGSKANHAGIQKLVVLMKDELEKIKEQLNNIA